MNKKTASTHWHRPLLALAVALLLPAVLRTSFALHLLIMILVWAMLGAAWNMLGGYAGQVSLGHAVFFGLGAYTCTLLLTKLNIIPWIGMVVGAALAICLAVLLGFPLFRLSGHYFTIGTIAVGEIFWIAVTNWNWAGGARGLFLPIKGNSLLYLQFTSKIPYYYIALLFFAISMIGSYFLSEKSRAGYYFRAIKDEPEAAQALGVDIRKYKILAYAFSAATTALAGGFFANYVLYIDPDSVLIAKVSTQMCLVTVLGGIGQLWGPLVGSLVLVPVSEFTRVYLSGGGRAADLIIYGVLIVFFAVFQPNGLLGLIRYLSALKGKNGNTPQRVIKYAERS